ncbi:MAG: calcium-binding protein [Geminicoccaceae bacterium]
MSTRLHRIVRASTPTTGDDVLVGTTGNDKINALAGNDSVDGLAGDDRLIGGPGNDTLNGNVGFDVADYAAATAGIYVDLANGYAEDGQGGTDTLTGIEEINGSKFADVISLSDASGESAYGHKGNDILLGQGGDDTLRPGSGNDTVDGGAGSDTVSYFFFASPAEIAQTRGIKVDLTLGKATDAWGNTDRLIGIENVEDTTRNDVMIGNALKNTFKMRGGGNDSVNGGGGDDRVDYSKLGTAVDVDLVAGTAKHGGSTDTLVSIERVKGTAFADHILGTSTAQAESFEGGKGADTIDGGGGTGINEVNYASAGGAVTVDLQLGTAQDGDGSTDKLTNINQVIGSAFGDTLLGSGGAEFFFGGAGADTIDGRGGIDRLDYGFEGGSRGIVANLAAGTIIDTTGATDIVSNIEQVKGTALADRLLGSALADRLEGGDRSDFLQGNGGNDVLIGGDGDIDTARFLGKSTGYTITLSGTDVIVTDTDLGNGNDGTDTLRGIEKLQFDDVTLDAPAGAALVAEHLF